MQKRNTLGVLGVLSILFGVALIVGQSMGVGWFLLGLAIPAIYHAYRYHRYEQHPLYRLIAKSSNQVVWVYHEVVRSMPFGIKTLDRTIVHFKQVDGTEETLFIPGKRSIPFLREIEPHFQSATFGYSLKKEQLYRANPLLLKR